jgi:pimeloyl-ACP methyl ester carboxylesterase
MKLDITIAETYSLSYTDTGKGTPVFFFPGGGASILYYKAFIAELEKHCRVIAINYPGFDKMKSDKSELSIDFYERCLVSAIKHFNFKENFVVTHSMGCGVTLSIDVHNPGLINKAVMFAPMLRQFTGPQHELATRVTLSAADSQKRELVVKRKDVVPFIKNVASNSVELIKQLDMLTHRFQVPLEDATSIEKIVVLGTKDVIFPYKEQIALVKSLSNVTIQTIEGAGHDLMFSHTETLIPMITEFFQHKV